MMSVQQKQLRRAARQRGKWALRALNAARHPVYDGDEDIYTARAVRLAREAWRYALLSAPRSAPDSWTPK